MNLIEALRTKKPLRRPIAKHMGSHGDGWLGSAWILRTLVNNGTLQYVIGEYPQAAFLSEEDILANDWEVKSLKCKCSFTTSEKSLAKKILMKLGS